MNQESDRLFKEKEELKGRVALITGAASGLGRGLALELARRGASIVAVDINPARLEETASLVEREGSSCLVKVTDVSQWEEMRVMADEVLGQVGEVDILVNNAGVAVGGELKDIPIDAIEWIVGVNLMGEVYGTKLFLPQMIQRRQGYIVNVASLSALVLLPGHIAYTTTKHALHGFSQALWAECRRYGVGVTLVCPGAMKTNIMEGTRDFTRTKGSKKGAERWGSLLERLGKEPEDAARIIVRAMERKRFLVLIGAEAYLLYYLTRISPGIMRHLVAAVSGRMFE